MQISPIVPGIGLFLIALNVIIAAVRPYTQPTIMGVELFIGGMIIILVSVVDLINPIGISSTERALLFISGCVNCSVGYYMVLLELRKQGV